MFIFPENFIWGSATASYQIEGGANQDGRQPSIWDTFSHTPGLVHENQNADVSTDHYNRMKEDVQLMKWLGLKAYRFSVSWSRVLKYARKEKNQAGIDFYNRLIDELLANDIEPWLTCFHWDLPQVLETELGGWRSRETAEIFGDYCGLLAELYSDRVKNFFTVNEFWNFTDGGYMWACKAPGLELDAKEIVGIRHNALLAHGLGTKAIRDAAKQAVKIGIADALAAPVPVIGTEENIAAARKHLRNSLFLHPIMEGKYSEKYLKQVEKAGFEYPEEDFDLIGSPLDFVGANTYHPSYVRANPEHPNGYEVLKCNPGHPTMDIEWLHVEPQSAYWVPRLLKEVWDVDYVVFSENGCCAKDQVTEKGEILDTDRLMYLRNHLYAAQRAVEEGWPLKGYFLWSLMDNFEWTEGFSKRFGIIHVDYETLKRTPKLSAEWYREVCHNNCLN